MIVPTVGRVVWYYPTATDEINGAGPLAALVAHVHSNDKVNLAVFDANGANHGLVGVRLLQDGDFAEVDEGYATWMPYQLGQAAKTEAAEAKAAAPASLVIEGDICAAFKRAAERYGCSDIEGFIMRAFEFPLRDLGYDVTVHYGGTLASPLSKLEITKR